MVGGEGVGECVGEGVDVRGWGRGMEMEVLFVEFFFFFRLDVFFCEYCIRCFCLAVTLHVVESLFRPCGTTVRDQRCGCT